MYPQRTSSSERWLALCLWLSCALHGDKVKPELAPDTLTVEDGEPYRNRQGSRSSGSVAVQDSGRVSISRGHWKEAHMSLPSRRLLLQSPVFRLSGLGATQLRRAPPEQCTVRDGDRQSRLWEQLRVRICAAHGLGPWRIKSCQTYRTIILEVLINAHVSTQNC